MLRKFIILGLLALGMVLLTSPAPLRALELGPDSLARVALPAGNIAIRPVARADFTRDGSQESLLLDSGRLTILARGQSVWQSPAAWTVIQAAITDLNHDGIPEATLLVWRPFRPWPVDQWLPYGGRIADFHDAAGDSCQIILIGWRNALAQFWHSRENSRGYHSTKRTGAVACASSALGLASCHRNLAHAQRR